MGATGKGRSHTPRLHRPDTPEADTPHATPGRSDAPGAHRPGTDTPGAEGWPRRPRPRRKPRHLSATSPNARSTARSDESSNTGSHTSLETAAEAFRLLTTGPSPLSLDGAAVGSGLPRRPIPLGELRAILLHPATNRATRDAVWRQVVTQAHSGTPAWVIAAVGLALPGLWQMAGDLAEGYSGDVADLHAAILTGFVTGLHRDEVSRPGISARLRWAAYRAGLLARYTRDGIPTMPLPPLESAPPPAPWAHPDLLLADAVAKGVLSPLAAELIGRSRLEGITLKQAAAELGVGVQAAYKARQRGERRLVAAIASGDVEHRVSNSGPKSGLFLVRAPNAPTPPTPRPRQAPKPPRWSGHKPADVRGRSTESDGTPDSNQPHREEGGEAFCGPARQPPPRPASSNSSASSSPSSSPPGSSRQEQPRRRRGNRRRSRQTRRGGTS